MSDTGFSRRQRIPVIADTLAEYASAVVVEPTWKFQHDSDAVHLGYPTDARGLRLRAQCGYRYVHMADASGWLQIHVAIRKVELRERIDALLAVTS